MKRYIEYKFDPRRVKMILKPDTHYWRFRYWLNQYVAVITWWVIIPIVNLNDRCGRLQDGEELMSLCEVHRMGLRLVSEDKGKTVSLLKLPWWMRLSKKLFAKSLDYWQGCYSFPKVYEKPGDTKMNLIDRTYEVILPSGRRGGK